MKKWHIRNYCILFVVLCILTGCAGNDTAYPTAYVTSAHPSVEQLKLPQTSTTYTIGDELGVVSIETEHLSSGYLNAVLNKDMGKSVKLSITKEGLQDPYYYDMTVIGKQETFPFTLGSGTYLIKILLNDSNDVYSILFSQYLDVALENEQIPFLYPNQVVDYNADSMAIKKAFELTKDDDTVLERISTLYNYVVDTISYDEEKAKVVDDIYVLPIIDETLSSESGICFDYAALLAAMLRSQQIPARLVTGNTSIEYHAWVEVYLPDKGWISAEILLKSKKWSRMDPTFAASGTSYEDGYENRYYY